MLTMMFKNLSFKLLRQGLLPFTFLLVFTFTFAQDEETSSDEGSSDGPDPQLVEKGKSIFKGECSTCHKFDQDHTGPALGGVTERRSDEWLKSWISNPAKFAQEDPDAEKLVEKWRPRSGMMQSFGFSDEEFNALIAYLEVGQAQQASEKEDEGQQASSDGGEGAGGGGSSDNMTLILAVVLIVLVLVILVLLLMSAVLMKYIKQREADFDHEDVEFVSQRHSIIAVLKHPAFIGIVVTIGVLVGLVLFVQKGLYGVGVQMGYAPHQPIQFSHKIHAGEHEIDCKYCHTGVTKGKNANIPAASICMNCHRNIKTESEKIQQIYKAIDYKDYEYGDNIKPIKWVRIHNLPDHVYFNHQQHVVVGGLECETCHGEISEMDVVYQYSTLTMGWCIDCHRNTEVKAEDNEYYDKLLEYHNEKGNQEPMTVEDIGGTECARCHY